MAKLCPNTNRESAREGRDLLSTHLSRLTADLSIKKPASCELIEMYKKATGNCVIKHDKKIRYNCGLQLLLQLSAMATAPPLRLQENWIWLPWLDICFQVCNSAKVMWLGDNNRMVMEIHAALHLCKWSSSQPVTLLENSCHVCQAAIPSARLALPACLYTPLLDPCL